MFTFFSFAQLLRLKKMLPLGTRGLCRWSNFYNLNSDNVLKNVLIECNGSRSLNRGELYAKKNCGWIYPPVS